MFICASGTRGKFLRDYRLESLRKSCDRSLTVYQKIRSFSVSIIFRLNVGNLRK